MIETILAKNLKNQSGLRHAFFTRKGGVSTQVSYEGLNCGISSQDDPDAVKENRRRVAETLGVPHQNLLSCYQVHSPDVVTVKNVWRTEDRPRADAMVTTLKNTALGILTADCVPVLFADASAGVIGAAHAGWRGALTGVLENTLKAMEECGAIRSRIDVALGPSIWPNSYEVGPEFPAPFLAENAEFSRYFRPSTRPSHFMFDVPGYVVGKLKAHGVMNIENSPADTAADEKRFFSYRRACLLGDKRAGSLISVIALTANPET
jgi:YfiH family protein